MIKLICAFSLFLLTINIYSQDERDFRNVFSGIHSEKRELKVERSYKWRTNTPFYYLDLTDDGMEESFGFEKKDGEDWIHFLDLLKRPFKSFRLYPKGQGSYLFRVQVRRISSHTKVIILYYFEGDTNAIEYTSTARLYFVTIDDNKLSTLKIYSGPYFLYEKEGRPEHYHKRRFKVGVYDFNKDGINEIVATYHNISRAYSYIGNGDWQTN